MADITDPNIVEFSRNYARPALVQWLQSGATAGQLLAMAQSPIPGGDISITDIITSAIQSDGKNAIVVDGGSAITLECLQTAIGIAEVVQAFLNTPSEKFNGKKPIDIIRVTASASGDTRSRI